MALAVAVAEEATVAAVTKVEANEVVVVETEGWRWRPGWQQQAQWRGIVDVVENAVI